jgi:cytochrome c
MSSVRPIQLIALAALLAACAAYSGNSGNKLTGDPVRGRQLFATNSCVACHSVTKGDSSTVGPSLFGVIGRQAGTAPSVLGASTGLKEYGVTWSVETLNEFLANPDAKVPGTPMTGILIDPQQRADVIAYLSSLTD